VNPPTKPDNTYFPTYRISLVRRLRTPALVRLPVHIQKRLQNRLICACGAAGDILYAGLLLFGHNPGVVLPKLQQQHNKLEGART
jgi:hypothetical protein